jgi:hypothetical protein
MQIMIVANLCYQATGETSTDFGLDDGTGRIKARQWLRDANSDETLDTR